MDRDMKTPYFDKAQEYYLDNESATPPALAREVATHARDKLPTMLPPDYAILRDENGIIEENPPVSAPCFTAPDPSGTKPWLGIAVH